MTETVQPPLVAVGGRERASPTPTGSRSRIARRRAAQLDRLVRDRRSSSGRPICASPTSNSARAATFANAEPARRATTISCGGDELQRRGALGVVVRRASRWSPSAGASPPAPASSSRWPLAEDPPLEVDRDEQVPVGHHHLGLAEHQDAAVAQREVEVAEDVRLRLRVEVHQRVAAHEHVEPRDRRVVDEVVAAEDQRAPQVGPERVPLAVALEVSLAQLRGHVLELTGRVRPRRARGERLLVDVGRVDLHAPLVVLVAERLAQQHGDRVRLLPGGAPGAPHADRLVGRLAHQQLRQALVAQVLPGRRVAEEVRDVDQQRVEQLPRTRRDGPRGSRGSRRSCGSRRPPCGGGSGVPGSRACRR